MCCAGMPQAMYRDLVRKTGRICRSCRWTAIPAGGKWTINKYFLFPFDNGILFPNFLLHPGILQFGLSEHLFLTALDQDGLLLKVFVED